MSSLLTDVQSAPESEEPTNSIHLVARDTHNAPLVDLHQIDTARAEHAGDRQYRRFLKGGGLLRLPGVDCFKLGEEGSSWVEPAGTGRMESYAMYVSRGFTPVIS